MSKNAPQEPILAFLQKQRELERFEREKEFEKRFNTERERENGRK